MSLGEIGSGGQRRTENVNCAGGVGWGCFYGSWGDSYALVSPQNVGAEECLPGSEETVSANTHPWAALGTQSL